QTQGNLELLSLVVDPELGSEEVDQLSGSTAGAVSTTVALEARVAEVETRAAAPAGGRGRRPAAGRGPRRPAYMWLPRAGGAGAGRGRGGGSGGWGRCG